MTGSKEKIETLFQIYLKDVHVGLSGKRKEC